MTNKLPKLTKKQQAIIKQLYKYRFLNRIQIQTLMNHKDYKTINLWLKDLRQKHYIEWIYSTHFAEKTKPAVYYLGLNGVRHLRQLTKVDEDGKTIPACPIEEVRKRYKEANRSQTFIDRCVAIANCCISLKTQNAKNKSENKNLNYYYQAEADYLLDDSYYHFILDYELIRPNLIFCQDKTTKGQEETLESYLLEIFDPTLPRYRLKKRLTDYVKFLDDEGADWQEQTNTEQLPIILLVCATLTDLIYAKRRTRGLIADAWEYEDEDEEQPRIRFTTIDKLKQSGVLAKDIWEQA